MYTKCKAIARVVKTHGRCGEVVAVSACDLSSVITNGFEVCIVPPALKGDRWLEVDTISGDASGYLIHFYDVDDINEASKLVGKTILADVDDLDEEFFLRDFDYLIDREVHDTKLGFIGSLTEIMTGPANDVWVVEGKLGEVLLPVIEDVVLEFIDEAKPIVVDVPLGLNEKIDMAKKDL